MHPSILPPWACRVVIGISAKTVAALVIGSTAGGAGTPLPVVVAGGLVALVFLGLAFGVWTGREVPRWILTRIGIGFSAVLMMGGVINLAVANALDVSNTVRLLGVLNLVSAALLLAGGLMLLAPSVRAWCGGKNL